MGIVINHPLDIRLSEVLTQMELESDDPEILNKMVYLGGPVQTERGFVIHRPVGSWETTLQVTDELGITTSKDIIIALAQGHGPKECLIALGYAGWGAGQLEEELANNAWLSGPADINVILNTPVKNRWESAAALVGIDINNISNDIGHA